MNGHFVNITVKNKLKNHDCPGYNALAILWSLLSVRVTEELRPIKQMCCLFLHDNNTSREVA